MLVSYTFRGKQHAVDLDTTATVKDLRQALKTKNGLAPARQALKLVGRLTPSAEYRFTSEVENISVAYRQFSEKFGEEGVLQVKDLGPQFSYKGVFIVEYAGPIAIMAIAASRPAWLFGPEATGSSLSQSALFAVWLWQAHFIKRELETLFVHKFSRPSMPLFNLFKNSWYYWTFAALVSYPLCNPNYLPPSQTCVTAGAVLMLVSEVVNFAVHFQLSNMRSTCTKGPVVFLGFLSKLHRRSVELGGFLHIDRAGHMRDLFRVCILYATAWLFTAVGTVQMSLWALEKHKAYRRQDPELRRRAIIPFVL